MWTERSAPRTCGAPAAAALNNATGSPPRRASGERQLPQVDAGLDPHLVQHRDEVLGGDVAGRPRRHRAAAELAEARLEGVAPRIECRQHVGETLTPGNSPAARPKTPRTGPGFATPVVSPKPTSPAPASRSRLPISKTRAGST